MIDIRLLREDPDTVRASQRARGEDDGVVDAVLAADERRRSSLTAFERLRAEQKSMGKEVAKAQGDEKQALLARTKELAAEVKSLSAAADEAQAELDRLMRTSATSSSPRCLPAARTTTWCSRRSARRATSPPRASSPRDHLALMEALDAVDMERGAKVSGARFYFLKGVGARLEMALLGLAMQKAIALGFVPLITPTLVKPEVMAGAGFLDHHADEVYRLEADDLYLVGTSEVALAGYHADEVVDLSNGPVRYAGQSTCYRREAGLVRQGHPGHHPGAPVQQDRDVRLLPARGRPGRARAAARPREGDARAGRGALPGHRHRRRRPRGARRRASTTARPGCPPRAGTAS